MVYKMLKIITALVVAALIPTSAMAGGKTLCDFFYGRDGNFEVKYDLRTVDPDYKIYQNPQGGIKFELWLGRFDTEKERDLFLKQIKKVIYYNRTTGAQYILRSPDIYKFIEAFSAEYSLWIGNTGSLLGKWKTIIYGKNCSYRAYFKLTQKMLDQEAPIPVDASVKSNGDANFSVKCKDEGADQYLLRVFDDEGIAWQKDMTCVDGICDVDVSAVYKGHRARIEARLYNQLWPALLQYGNPDTCNPYGMNPGLGSARSITWFRIE